MRIKKYKIFFILLLIFFLGACGTANTSNSKGQTNQESQTEVEVLQGDFIYRIVTEKSSYQKGEKIKLHAEIEYVGDKDEIKIYHAASPFYFNMTEITRGFEIDYPMEQPLIETTLKKGEPLRANYWKAGGYSDQDPKEFVQFMKEFLEGDGFPEGQYQVEGIADFSLDVSGSPEEWDNVEIRASVNISVED